MPIFAIMTIVQTTITDLETIRGLYEQAIQFQKEKSGNHWHGMNQPLVEREIAEGLHWKIVEDGIIACFFSIAFTDRLVWDERDTEPSIYLHRIITNPKYRGKGYVRHITAWAEHFGRATGKQYIRLDTHRDNRRLNQYYLECGYTYCGIKTFNPPVDGSSGAPGIPKHYLGQGLSLYERRIPTHHGQMENLYF